MSYTRDTVSRDNRKSRKDNEAEEEPASLDELDRYMEDLYEFEDLPKMVQGTHMILQLARYVDNLGYLIEHESLLPTLARALKDEAKKSTDLVVNIVQIFYTFSNFSQFHPIILQYSIHDMVLKTISLEIKRHTLRLQALSEKKGREEVTAEELEKEQKRFKIIQKKQDQLLSVCFRLLLNLAENIAAEHRMVKNGIIKLLVIMLERRNKELLEVTMMFLKKLSIVAENKDFMAENKIIDKLVKFVSINHEELTGPLLRLLLNLSFDEKLRDDMIKNGMIPKLLDILKKMPNCRHITLRLMYHMSLDDRGRSMFGFTDAIPLILRMIVHFPEARVGQDLVALAVNVTLNSTNCQKLVELDGLTVLLTRVMRTRDPLLMKVVRNMSQHDGQMKQNFMPYLQELLKLCVTADSPDLLVEVLGTLANLPLDQNFGKFLSQYNLLDFLHKFLVPGAAEDDLVLEVICLIGVFAVDSHCALQLAKSRVLKDLYDLITAKSEDDEMTLQILYAFHRLLIHKEIRDVLLQTQIVQCILEFLEHRNPEVQKLADETLDVIQEVEERWAPPIRRKRFHVHNSVWLDVIDQDEQNEEAEQEELRHIQMQEELQERRMQGLQMGGFQGEFQGGMYENGQDDGANLDDPHNLGMDQQYYMQGEPEEDDFEYRHNVR